MLKTDLSNLLKIKYPIIQAPMAGGITTSTLVAEVSNAGGLGMIGAAYMTPLQIQQQVREIRSLTSKPFGINLFVPNDYDVTEEELKSSNKLLNSFRQRMNLKPIDIFEAPPFNKIHEIFIEQIKVIVEENIPICSFTFGIPSREVIGKLKKNNILLIGTATTVNEAIQNEKQGMDMIVVQGSEAGGHRGTFINDEKKSLIGLMSLLPQVVDNVNVPVIAAGGIMDGRGLTASICLGASGVQMGTAFLTCIESGAHSLHKEAIIRATEDNTVLTRSFSGKLARGINNKFISEMKIHETTLPDFPIQNMLTHDLRKAATAENNQDFMSLWSGQSPRLAKSQTVESLIKSLISEATNLISK